jgi:succinoglycan biosynthesis protein ExoM
MGDSPTHYQIRVTVCICTFRRPSIVRAIESVARQALPPDIMLRILVIDNDIAPTARNVVEEFRASTGVALTYRHVPGQNISVARNAGIDAVTTPWLVFMDDDEFASPDWLAQLLAARKGAHVVFGPCQAIYPSGTPDWIRVGDYHSNRISEHGTPIDTGYTSNVLIDIRFVRRHDLSFDIEFGRTGGEDTLFFHAMYRKGAVLRYAPSALVFEEVVPSRVHLKWIVLRRFRAGQVYAIMSESSGGYHYLWVVWTALLKAIFCAMMWAIMAFRTSRAMWWLMRGAFHAGVVSNAIGANVHEEYAAKSR